MTLSANAGGVYERCIVAKKKSSDLPLEPLHDLLAWWKQARVPGIIIGGLAVALHGRPRATRDVDAVILLDEARWPGFLALAKPHRFTARIDDPLAFARRSRVFLLRHIPSQIDVDMSVGSLPFEREAIEHAAVAKVGRLTVPLVTVEDLIVFKAIPHRDRDLIDIEGLLEIHPHVNQERIRSLVDDFAQLLEMPDIFTDVDRLLRKHLSKPGRRKRS